MVVSSHRGGGLLYCQFSGGGGGGYFWGKAAIQHRYKKTTTRTELTIWNTCKQRTICTFSLTILSRPLCITYTAVVRGLRDLTTSTFPAVLTRFHHARVKFCRCKQRKWEMFTVLCGCSGSFVYAQYNLAPHNVWLRGWKVNLLVPLELLFGVFLCKTYLKH